MEQDIPPDSDTRDDTQPDEHVTFRKGDLAGCDVSIVRFYSQTGDGFVHGHESPPPQAFKLNENDKNDELPHLSVWDNAITNVTDARRRLREEKKYSVYQAISGAINKCVAEEHPDHQMTTIRAPISDGLPNGHGHCGITGFPLKHKTFSQKQLSRWRKALRAELADLFKLLQPDL